MPAAVPKITIRQAVAQGADGLLIDCCERTCRRHAKIPMDRALAVWGPERRLDQVAAVCSVCGGRNIDVRPGYPKTGPGGLPL